MSLSSTFDRFRAPISTTNPVLRAVDVILRGVGQVVFQSNWLSGLLLLVAIGFNSRVYLVAAVLGVVVSTSAAVALQADRAQVAAGLYGYNGTLAGIGLTFAMSHDVVTGDWPDLRLYLLIAVAAALSTVLVNAVSALLSSHRVPTLTAPFVLASWLMLFGVYAFTGFTPGAVLTATTPTQLTSTAAYTALTLWNGTWRGIGEIFFQDNVVSGVIVVVGVLVNTRIGALMCVGGSAGAALIAMAAGADEGAINAGLYGYNAALTAMALGGVFIVVDAMGLLYTASGVVVTTFAWPAVATVLAPIGMPTFTFPFVLTTWIFLLARPGFAALTPRSAA